MKTSIIAGLCTLLLIVSNPLADCSPISIEGIVDDKGEVINYDENYKTNLEDEKLIQKIEEKVICLAHAEVLYNCSSASDIQATDMLKYIEYVSHKYHPMQRGEQQKSPVITLNREQVDYIIESEFGISDGLNMYGGTTEDIEYICNLAQSNMNIGVIPIELWQENEYIDATVLVNYQTPIISLAMKYRFKIDDDLHFVSAARLPISEQSGGRL